MSAGGAALLDRFARPWRQGTLLWRRAAWIPLLVVIPELIQHGVEWQLGMFASRAAFKAQQFDPIRLAPGVVKQALWFVVLFLAARRAADFAAPAQWRRMGLAIPLMAIAALAPWPLAGHLPEPIIEGAGIVLMIPFVLLFVMLIGAVLGDPALTLRHTLTDGWRKAALVLAVPALPTAIGQWGHRQNHHLAMGQPLWIVGLLMVWDALWVGTITCWMGAALASGYGAPLAKR